jgi:hypothetical protein
MIFAFVTAAHLRVYRETGARPWVLVIALLVIVVTLLTFIFTTLIQEPASLATLAVILAVSIALDLGWTRTRDRRNGSRQTHGDANSFPPMVTASGGKRSASV